jgi:NitT/TauT family transport system permease protein
MVTNSRRRATVARGVAVRMLPPMRQAVRDFGARIRAGRAFTLGDLLVLALLATGLYAGLRLALRAPAEVHGPSLSLDLAALPWYACRSTARMAAAYALSLLFALWFGGAAAKSRGSERLLMPVLDVLQSVPILSFLPIVLMSATAVLPEGAATELASIVLIFTSQAWNLAYSYYQSSTLVPHELREAAAVARLPRLLRFRTLELPFAAIGLIWNSVMSWAGGWFFLMAAESFRVGDRDFRLPGLGSYLQSAAANDDTRALVAGALTLVVVVVLLDQLVWRPLLAWSTRFKLDAVEGEDAPTSWFLSVLRRSTIAGWVAQGVLRPALAAVDRFGARRAAGTAVAAPERQADAPAPPALRIAVGALALGAAYGGWRAAVLLAPLPLRDWAHIGVALLATAGRVAASLLLALLWTVPAGVAIGLEPRLARIAEPLLSIAASFPATALFPAVLLALAHVPGGLDLGATLLMSLGTMWYLLFNVVAGAHAIPQDLLQTTKLLRLPRLQRWRTLILPALFPYLVTGAITAAGGAWNASIVAERVHAGHEVLSTTGIGALIAEASDRDDGGRLLLAATLALVACVLLLNRLVWRRLYRLAAVRYRVE